VRSRASRLTLVVFAVLFTIEGLYLLGANLLLRGRLAQLSEDGAWTFDASGLCTLYPGDLRAQSVRLTQGGLGWTIQLGRIEARLAFLPLLRGVVRLYGLRAQHLEGRFVSATFGSWQLDGPGELGSTSVIIASGQAGAEAELRFTGARLTRPGRPGKATLRGKVSVRLALPSATGSSWRQRLVVKARGSAELHEVEGILGLEPSSLRLAQARLQGHCAFRHGKLKSCDAELESDAASGRRGQVNWRAKRGVRIRVTLTDDPAQQLRATLSCEHVQLDVARPDADRPLTLEAAATLQLRAPLAGIDATHVVLAQALLSWQRSAQAPQQAAAPGELDFTRAQWSRTNGLEIAGRVRESGPDAAVLLDLLDVEPALSWSLSELRGRAFHLEMALRRSALGWAAEDIDLETHGLAVHGSVYWDRHAPRGALLVKRGKLELGLLLHGDSSELDLRPGRQWLSNAIRQLGEVGTGT